MNTFEVGVISAIPVGGIIGGLLCKSFGLFAVIGGVIAGIFAGGLAGWAFGLFIITVSAFFMVVWTGIKKLPDQNINDKEHLKVMDSMKRNSNQGTFGSVLLGSTVGFTTNWWCGLIVAGIYAIITAIVVVTVWHCGVRKIQARETAE